VMGRGGPFSLDEAFVHAVAVSGSTVYAGGTFRSLNQVARRYIAALAPGTGQATTWNPAASGDVWALAATDTTVYAGGDFTAIDGHTRKCIAAIARAPGTTASWIPRATFPAVGPASVEALAVSGSTVYAGGLFWSLGGQTRKYVGAVDATSGSATSW